MNATLFRPREIGVISLLDLPPALKAGSLLGSPGVGVLALEKPARTRSDWPVTIMLVAGHLLTAAACFMG